jgi:transcriptional regulator of acetoin/glycerol metabolism
MRGVSEEALRALVDYNWPGNVRELAHVLERVITLNGSTLVTVEDLPPEVCQPESRPGGQDGPLTLAEMKRHHVLRALAESGGNMRKTAKALGVDRRSVYRMLERYGNGTGRRSGPRAGA